VELTVLGMSGTWPPAGGATCGYLLSHDGTTIWLDAGTGTFSRLQQHIAVDELDAIVISHGHPDHFVDAIPCFYARHYGKLGPPGLPFYSPPGFVDLISLLVSEGGRDVMGEAYAFRTVHGGDSFTVGSFTFDVREMTHVGVHAMGFRIEAGGHVLAYTGDTGPCSAVDDLARGADLLLAEATYQEDSEILPFHLSAKQAGEHATSAGVGRLLLTHLTPGLDPEISRAEAAAAFDGTVEVAFEDMKVEIGS
jgi:ribonuclease BN (tRNA processing enzyme)